MGERQHRGQRLVFPSDSCPVLRSQFQDVVPMPLELEVLGLIIDDVPFLPDVGMALRTHLGAKGGKVLRARGMSCAILVAT